MKFEGIPDFFLACVEVAHVSWRAILLEALQAMVQRYPAYLMALDATSYLPSRGRVFSAFAQPLDQVRYVLFGEGPYPREASATGFCFMDGAVGAIWSQDGFSKPVNRATSLRNFFKMLLVAEGQISSECTDKTAIAGVAKKAGMASSMYVQTLAEVQNNLLQHGFLLLNATLVYRSDTPPAQEAKAWLPFVAVILQALLKRAQAHQSAVPILVLWGSIAQKIEVLPVLVDFPKVVSEHPYNISFITNETMHRLFGPMHLLSK